MIGTPGSLFVDRWTPGPNGIYFLDGSKTPATLNLLNLTTRKISHVSVVSGRLTDWGSGPSLSADGLIDFTYNASGACTDITVYESASLEEKA